MHVVGINLFNFAYNYPTITITTVIVISVIKAAIEVSMRAEIVAIDNSSPIRRDSVINKIAAVAMGSVVGVIGWETGRILEELVWIAGNEIAVVASLNKFIYSHGYTLGPYPFKLGHIQRAAFIMLGFIAYSWTAFLIKSNPSPSPQVQDRGVIQNNLNNPIVRAIAFVANKIFQGDDSKKQTINNIKRVLKIARNCGLVASGLLSSIQASYPNYLAWKAAMKQVALLMPISIITGIISAILDREECKRERDVNRLRQHRNELYQYGNNLREERDNLREERDDLLRAGLIPIPMVAPVVAARQSHEGPG